MRKIKLPRTAAFVLALAAIALAIGVAWVARRNSAASELVAGYNGFIPYVMPGRDGPTGLAVEIVNRAARRAHIKLKWVASGDDVDGALRAGKIDFFPMLTITPARTEEFHISAPWWENETALISLEARPLATDSRTAGKRIAIRGLPILKNLAKVLFPRATLVIIPGLDAMVGALCTGGVDAVFIDFRLWQSQLLKGPAACVDHPLHVVSVENGSMSLGTIARKGVSGAADRLYAQIAVLAVDGTLAETASRWSMTNSFQNHHMKDILDAQRRESLFRYGMVTVTIILILTAFQTQRIRRARSVAEESQQRFDAFINHTPAITFIKDEWGRIVYMNRALPGTAGQEDIASQLRGDDSAVIGLNRSVEVTETVTLPSGEERHFLSLKFPFVNAAGKRFIGSVALDITARKKAEEALRFSQFSIDRSPDTVLWIDSRGRIFYANDAACLALAFSRAELLDLTVYDIDRRFKAFEKNLDEIRQRGSLTVESEFRTREGTLFPVEVALYHLEFDGSDFICCIGRDITERKRAQVELSHQAQHDLLTGLPNRRHFETQLANRIESARASGDGLAVLYFDLDGFKLINDTLGHALGDVLLKQLVLRMEGCVRDTDTLARMGGDEFTLIAPGIENPESAELLAGKLMAGLQESFFLDGHELCVTASAGVSLFPKDGHDCHTLLQNADAAMYEGKREGKNRLRFFDPQMNVRVRERLELENHLRRAIDKGELSLHYQPVLSLTTNRAVRYEALLRWNHPVFGMIPPMKFIPIAEETGLIVPIGAWVLEEACLHARRLLHSGETAGVAVNVSSVQFARPDFVETAIGVVLRSGIPPSLIELEVTETVVMNGIESVAKKIAQLRAIGITVSMDDFGTGYSSLSYLQKLRIDTLKIDQSFVREVPHDPDATCLTQALVSLAHSLGMEVVVEGIETEQQLRAVRDMGCDMVQGYLLGRPAPAAASLLEYELAEIA